MGIRVHKVLGYGLDDVKHGEYWPDDPRIDTEKLQTIWDITTQNYLEWLDTKYGGNDMTSSAWSLDHTLGKDGVKYYFHDCISYDGEYGLSNVIVLTPLAMKDWRRYDDGIDYMLETYVHAQSDDPQPCHVEKFGVHGIYPWNGLYMDARTGEKIKDGVRWIQANWDPPMPEEYRRVLAKSLGYDNLLDADEYIVPVVPDEVRDIIEYSGIFTNDGIWKQLRPMLYTYWS